MTNGQIIEMAKRAGFSMENSAAIQAAERFAQLVRNAALEEAAIKSLSCGIDWHMRRNSTDVREVGSAIAHEIRSMKK